MPPWLLLSSTIATAIGAIVTAVATIFLWRVTKALAKETKRLVDLGAQPHVVATIEVNQWSMRHADLRIVNTGNAAAYDIVISFDPPLSPKRHGTEQRVPFQSISVLRPGQELASSIGEIFPLLEEVRSVEASWKRGFMSDVRETNKYNLDLRGYAGLTRLGGATPLTEIAQELKKLREDWREVARGNRRMDVNSFDASDRAQEEAERESWFREMTATVDQEDSNPGSSQMASGSARSADTTSSE